MQPACVFLFHSLHVTGPRRGLAPLVHLHSTRSPCACRWPTDVGGSRAACALSYWQLLHRSCSEAVRRLHTRTLGMMTSSEAERAANHPRHACLFSFLQCLGIQMPICWATPAHHCDSESPIHPDLFSGRWRSRSWCWTPCWTGTGKNGPLWATPASTSRPMPKRGPSG